MSENLSQEATLSPEELVSEYLKTHPHYFNHHPDVFCKIIPPRQNRGGTRSLMECQNEVLRASLTTYEMREEELKEREEKLLHQQLEFSSDVLNLAVALVEVTKDYQLPSVLLRELKKFFGVDKGIVRLWLYRSEFEGQPFTLPFSDEIEAQISDMSEPFIGENSGSEIASWFNVPIEQTKGVLLIPIKAPNDITFGVICLTATSVKPFTSARAKQFLSQALPLVRAALLRLTR